MPLLRHSIICAAIVGRGASKHEREQLKAFMLKNQVDKCASEQSLVITDKETAFLSVGGEGSTRVRVPFSVPEWGEMGVLHLHHLGKKL